jgi:hypothetical protein
LATGRVDGEPQYVAHRNARSGVRALAESVGVIEFSTLQPVFRP